jgi:hypothetical protein
LINPGDDDACIPLNLEPAECQEHDDVA